MTHTPPDKIEIFRLGERPSILSCREGCFNPRQVTVCLLPAADSGLAGGGLLQIDKTVLLHAASRRDTEKIA